jgi:2-oxoglutarate ferredoxin oxidoreductase subunit alpha
LNFLNIARGEDGRIFSNRPKQTTGLSAMQTDISVKICGEAGQGIITVGELLTQTCHRAGYHVFANNEFESRIRGGLSFIQVRIGDEPIAAPDARVHLLAALNEASHRAYREEMVSGGISILGQAEKDPPKDYLSIPFDDLARQAGARITSNTVAAGVCLGLLGLPLSIFETVLKDRFASKGDKAVGMNLKAGRIGYGATAEKKFSHRLKPEARTSPKGRLINGARALALGALAGNCRFGAFYPMSPATGIMENLIQLGQSVPLVVEQAEDELAAVNMIIGASFAGVRSLTATSGGGFCLMTEGLGLAAITETPLVIINAQRPGPATGLPTRTAQGDLQFVIRASQDEFPRFVFAPGSAREAFDTMARAFHLSEAFQVPAIVLVDKFFTDSIFTETEAMRVPRSFNPGTISDEDMPDPERYKRFALTPSGVSPRALPGRGRALVVATGNEHREDGHLSEAKADRRAMVEKRLAKLPAMQKKIRPPHCTHPQATMQLVAWGSSRGAVQESVQRLREDGVDIGSVLFHDLWPFPADQVCALFGQDKRFIMVEQNATAQLGALIRQETGLAYDGTILKYDGRPFSAEYIVDHAKPLLGE